MPELVSVVIPAFNAHATIGDQLDSLLEQTYQGSYQIIVADNGSTDSTKEEVDRYSHRGRVRVIDASARRGASYARNRGIAASTGDLVLMCDADDLVADTWIDAMTRAACSADIVAGQLEDGLLNDPDVRSWRGTHSRPSGPMRALKYLPFAPSGNMGVWRDVFEQVGSWREDLRCGEDTEYSWRAQLQGFTLGFAPDAVVHYRHRSGVGSMAKQIHCFGIAQARLYKEFRELGAMRRSCLAGIKQWLWLLVHIGDLLSTSKRGIWIKLAARNAGRLHGSIRYGVLFL